jgi:ZIP family zinc transporter
MIVDPEELAISVAFGAVAAGFPSASLMGAIALAIGIGIQNFPDCGGSRDFGGG